MLNYKKISFNECDDEYPVQFFFDYDLTQDELDKFIAYYTGDGELDESKNVIGVKLCLSMFSYNDWKLEGFFSYDDGTKDCVELLYRVSSAHEFMDIVKNTNTKESQNAYALYEASKNYKKDGQTYEFTV